MKTKILLLTSLTLTSNLAWGAAAELGALARVATRVASRAAVVSVARPVLPLATRPFAVEVFPVSPFPVRAFSTVTLSPMASEMKPLESTYTLVADPEKSQEILDFYDIETPLLDSAFEVYEKIDPEILRDKVKKNCLTDLSYISKFYPLKNDDFEVLISRIDRMMNPKWKEGLSERVVSDVVTSLKGDTLELLIELNLLNPEVGRIDPSNLPQKLDEDRKSKFHVSIRNIVASLYSI